MLTELRVLRSRGRATDVVVDHDGRTTVGCVADAIADHVGLERGLTLQRDGLHGTVLDPAAPLLDSGLQRGDGVLLVAPRPGRSGGRPGGRSPDRQLTLTVVDGPERGRVVPLRSGVRTIGRGRGMDVRLDDESVSRHHADLAVGWLLELTDRDSANGTLLDGVRVDGTVRVEPGARIRMGDTTLTVTSAPGDRRSDLVEVNRPPRIVMDHEPVRVRFPTPPDRGRPFHFPWISLVAGLLMGVAFMALSGGALRTGAFYLLMPLLLVAGAVEARLGGSRDHAADVRGWRETVVERLARLCDAEDDELAAASHRHPPTEELAVTLESMGTRLWEREPHHPDFLSVRLGSSSRPTANTIEVDDAGAPALRAELAAQLDGYRHVDGMPMVVGLDDAGHLGLAGRADGVAGLARSLVLQTAIAQSPAEVAVALLVDEPRAPDWDWAKWLPHLRSGAAILGGEAAGVGLAAATEVLGRLEALVAQRSTSIPGSGRSDSDAPGPEKVGRHGDARGPAWVVVYDAALGIDRARMNELLTAGPAADVHILWLDESFGALPSRAGASAVVRSDGAHADVALVRDGRTTATAIETTTAERAAELAIRLAPLADASNRLDAASELPASLSLADLLDEPALWFDPAVIERRWSTPSEGLHAAIGVLPNGRPLTLDLRRDGPHALVAGTTGSGKSELLQTLISSLAAAHPPTRVNFLLIDYKGGAAFSECAHLPHTVGMVTDLEPAGTRRVLVALDAELRRRERLLARAGARDLAGLEHLDPAAAPASLVVVVDEFAALSREVPELADGMVDIAQRGRSLGLHLVLATQRPAGVVTEAIRANTNLRVALRVSDAAESLDVVGSPIAAAIARGTPGRAAVRVGADELHIVQTAWVGGQSAERTTSGGVRVSGFRLGAPAGGAVDVTTDDRPPDDDHTTDPIRPVGRPVDVGTTDLHRLTATTSAAARRMGLPAPFRPWRDPLPDHVDLASIGTWASPTSLPFGIVDLPEQQLQVPAVLDLAVDGHLAVLGGPGTGTTTLLRTLAAAATLAAIHAAIDAGLDAASGGSPLTPAPIRVDAIDASGRGLAAIAGLPVVGSVLDASGQVEQVLRLLRMLRAEMDARSETFAGSGVDDLEGHLAAGGAPRPRRLLLLDGLTAFQDLYDGVERGVALATLDRLLADGRRLGLHLVVVADRRAGLAGPVLRAIPRHVQLGPSDEGTAAAAASGARSLPPGRAVLDGHQAHVAVLGGDASGAGQHAALRALAQRAADAGVPVAAPVPLLPTLLPRIEVEPSSSLGALVVGRLDHDLAPARIDLTRGAFCIFGTPGSGKSTALRSLAEEVRDAVPTSPIVLLAPHEDPVHADGPWARIAIGLDECRGLVEQLASELGPESGTVGRDGVNHGPTLCLDDLTDLLDDGFDAPLLELLRLLDRRPGRVIAAGDASRSSGWSDSMRRLRSGRRGVLLAPHLDQHGDLLGTELPRTTVSDLTPGRGFLVERKGRPSLVQLCAPRRH